MEYEHDNSMIEKYDTALLGILQHEGQISKFLDVILGFLYRRTDYFLIMDDKHGKMGFPPGVASKVLYQAFKKFDEIAEANRAGKASKFLPAASEPTDTIPPAAVTTVEITTDEVLRPRDTTVGDSSDVVTHESMIVTPAERTKVEDNKTEDDKTEDDKQKLTDDPPSRAVPPPPPPPQPDMADSNMDRPVYSADAECYNGAKRDNYSWSQSIADLDVYIKVPSHVTKGRQVRVRIERKKLRVWYEGIAGGSWDEPVRGDLCWEVRADDSVWTLEPGNRVHINLEKVMERWWEALLVGEATINVSKIDASRPMSDLGDEEQAKLGELMFNEQQKRLGLPQSHEMKTQELLKKAWDAEGSPFKGQPYDPSCINIDPAAVSSLTK